MSPARSETVQIPVADDANSFKSEGWSRCLDRLAYAEGRSVEPPARHVSLARIEVAKSAVTSLDHVVQ